MRAPVNRDWTDEEIDILKVLWLQGQSASVIGRTFERSRSAVLGKIHRLKMHDASHTEAKKHWTVVRKKREAAVRKEARKQVKIPRSVKRSALTMAPVVKAVEAPDLAALRSHAWQPLANTSPKPLETLGSHDCRWPLHDGPFLFCAEPIRGVGYVYCATHTAMSEGRK